MHFTLCRVNVLLTAQSKTAPPEVTTVPPEVTTSDALGSSWDIVIPIPFVVCAAVSIIAFAIVLVMVAVFLWWYVY